MNCARNRTSNKAARIRSSERAFTLAEVLAAMLFMAIVIPVAMQGLRIASLAGEVAERKSHAARIAERLLYENLLLSNSILTSVTGTVTEGTREYRYSIRSDIWDQHLTNQPSLTTAEIGRLQVTQPEPDALAVSEVNMSLVTVHVFYSARGQEYSVDLSTLVSLQ